MSSSKYIFSKYTFERIVMNPDNYPIETRIALPHSVQYTACPSSSWGYYWRGVSLSLYSLLLFKDRLSWELNVAQNDRYPDAPFPVVTRNFQRVRDADPVRWNHANICFIQAQARKIQKFWRNLPTEVAMPCAEDVEQ